ncbi:PH domain-containing protein [Marinactinospora rubrisoli]|uniref:PH domain-containing protein n=1 Tax=Marinactinospora rubrisoli TaxID=2715399 RepID=A0ABW2KDP9_9ACTN
MTEPEHDRSVEAAPPVPPDGVPAHSPEPEYRLSALTMVTAPVRYLRSFVVPIVVALVAGGFDPWALGSSGAAVAGMFVVAFVNWRTVRYQVGAERLEIRRGLIGRSRRTIPLERIRGVDVTSTLLHRLLGLAVVRIEAAAGGRVAEEGKLDAVTLTEAERLRRVLLHRRAVLGGAPAADAGPTAATSAEGASPDPAEHAEPSEPAPGDTEYFRMPRAWYLYAMLSLGYLLTPFAALAAFVGFVAQVLSDLDLDVDSPAAVGAAEWLLDGGTTLAIALLAGTLLVLVLLMPIFAVASYAINNWGFTLRRRDSALVTERGLFTRRSATLEHRRIRGHALRDNPLERWRGAVRLRAIVTGLGDAASAAALLPTGPRDRVDAIVEQALTPYRGALAPHPPAARTRRLVRAVGPFALAGAVALAGRVYWLAAILAVLAALGVLLGLDRYRALGHGFDGHQVSVRSGSLRREQAVLRRDAVIGWRWRQTLFQRRAGLATLQIAVGAGGGTYDAVDAGFGTSVAFAADVTPALLRPFLVEGGGEGSADAPAPSARTAGPETGG